MNEEVEKELREQAQAIDKLTAQIYLLTQRVTFLENEQERRAWRAIQRASMCETIKLDDVEIKE